MLASRAPAHPGPNRRREDGGSILPRSVPHADRGLARAGRPVRLPDQGPAEQPRRSAGSATAPCSAAGQAFGTETSRPGRRRRSFAIPPDCLLTTPESLEVMLVSGGIDAASLFANLQGCDRGRGSRIRRRRPRLASARGAVPNPEVMWKGIPAHWLVRNGRKPRGTDGLASRRVATGRDRSASRRKGRLRPPPK